MTDATDAQPAAGLDRLLGGRLTLRQLAAGHRAGTDAVLLAAAAAPEPGDRIIDAGSGVGTVGLLLALRAPRTTVHLIEREPVLAALARDNAALNGLGDRVGVEEADLLSADWAGPAGGPAGLVVSNPPFYEAAAGRPSPDPLKAAAHAMAGSGTAAVAGDWLSALLRCAGPRGRIVMIHRPEALPALLRAAEGRLGGLRIRPVHGRAGKPAIRMLLGGSVGSRAPLAILPALTLHDESGRFTALAEAIHRGEAVQPLLDERSRKSRPQGPAVPRRL